MITPFKHLTLYKQLEIMTAKEFVINKIPNAKSEKHSTKGFRARTYWLIRVGRDTMWFAQGIQKQRLGKKPKKEF